jgi:hypothetical protein
MGNKRPQPTAVLIQRLRRAARALDGLAMGDAHDRTPVAWKAFANTCLQAAGRLEDLEAEIAGGVVVREDDGVTQDRRCVVSNSALPE